MVGMWCGACGGGKKFEAVSMTGRFSLQYLTLWGDTGLKIGLTVDCWECVKRCKVPHYDLLPAVKKAENSRKDMFSQIETSR